MTRTSMSSRRADQPDMGLAPEPTVEAPGRASSPAPHRVVIRGADGVGKTSGLRWLPQMFLPEVD